MKNKHILLVEDDPNFGSVMRDYLMLNDYEVTLAKDGIEGFVMFKNNDYDLCILDVMMPRKDGFSLAEDIRKNNSQIPIIFLTAKTMKEDVLRGYQVGADDYLTKPFSTDELLARLRVSLRRAKFSGNNQNLLTEVTTFTNGWLKINYLSKCVFVNEKEIHLTPIEYKLLYLLAENLDRVMTYNYLVKEIWGYYEEDFSALRVFANTLRKKIELDSNYPKMIQTHIGVGYRMIKID